MEKELFQITEFGGVVNRIDPKDIRDTDATTSDHVDGDALPGVVVGIPQSSGDLIAYSALFTTAERSAWIRTNDGKWNLAISQTGATKVVTDWYGTPALDTGFALYSNSFVVHDQEVYCGTGAENNAKWYGYISWQHFGAIAAPGWYNTNAKLPQPAATGDGEIYISAITPHAGTMAFDTNKRYDYAVSIVYDYTQESPLCGTYYSYDAKPEIDADYVAIRIFANNSPTVINKRITAVKLYRRTMEYSDATTTTLWRLVKSFDITSATAYDSTVWVAATGDYYVDWSDYNTNDGGSAYEQETGIAETLTSSDVNYTLNTSLNGYHYITDCAKAGIPSARLMMFKSKPYRFSMFDWSTVGEYLKFPTRPLAFVAFANRLWAFDENRTYKINPELMMIEDTTEGVGCISQRSVVVTDFGMYWCDAKNAYWHDGNNIHTIGDMIRFATATVPGAPDTAHWHGYSFGSFTLGNQLGATQVILNSQKNYIVFMVYGSSKLQCWAWHVRQERWDKWSDLETASSVYSSLWVGRYGELYCATGNATGNKITKPIGGGNTRAASWTSKEIDFGNVNQIKRLYKILIEPYGAYTITVDYTIDGVTTAGANSPVTLSPTNGKKIKIKINLAVGQAVKSLAIIFRRFLGIR